MARKLLPKKLIIEFDDRGEFRTALLAYRIREGESVDMRNMKTITIDNANFSKPQFNDFLVKVKEHVVKAENCDE